MQSACPVQGSPACSQESLRAAIAADLAVHVPAADAYQQRLHTATILRAAMEMRTQ